MYRVIPSRFIDSTDVYCLCRCYLVADGACMVRVADHRIQKPQLQPVGLEPRRYLDE